MNEMVENVARAICKRRGALTKCELRDARAAIKAMRKPTEDMIIAGACGIGGPINPSEDEETNWNNRVENALSAWGNMLAKALR